MLLTNSLMRGCILSVLISVSLIAAPGQYYRSIRSGAWNDLTVWESASDAAFSVGVQPAVSLPDSNGQIIRISSGDTITITASLVIDEVIVEQDGVLIYGNYAGSIITLSDGPGIDLMVYGTFEDNGPSNLLWQTSQSSWALGNQATMVRSRSTSATQWRDHYENGMSNIPATSNWILRKLILDPPSISGVNTWYGNLRIENFTATFWNANLVGSKITGVNSAPVVKGNLEIGTSGLSGVKFYSQNSAVNRLRILGDLTIGANSEFHLEDATTTSGASGIELWGNLIVQGTLSYDPNERSDQNRTLVMAGQSDQYISGSGLISIYNFMNSKLSGDVILLRALAVENKFILDNGQFDLNGNIFTLHNGASTAIERINGWVKSERPDFTSVFSWNIGNTTGVHEFPFGMNGEYIPVLISVSSGDIGLASVATYGTVAHNLPLPVSPPVANLLFRGIESAEAMVDRFWYVQKTGMTGTAQCTFTFGEGEKQGSEQTIVAIPYNELSDQWMEPSCCQTQSFVQRKVTVPGVQQNTVWSLIAPDEALYLEKENNFLEKEVIVSHKGVLFPVPCQGEVFFLHELQSDPPVHFEIYNALGKKILEGDWMDGERDMYRIDLSEIEEKGNFYLQVKDSFSVKNYKIILE